jgi:hypothetical protein
MGTKALRAPDGTIYDVPEADAAAAIADGYKEADVLVAPDGNEYDVPVADVDSALADGYKRPGAVAEPPAASVSDANAEAIARFEAPGALEAPPEEPSTWDNLKYAATHPVEAGKDIWAAGQTLAEQALTLGGSVTTPVAAAEAALPYLADKGAELLGGAPAPTFGQQMDTARQGIDARAERFKPTAVVGGLAGNVGLSIATGGLGTQAVGAKLLSTEAAKKLSGTAVKLLGPKVAGLVGTGIGLAAEGAAENAAQAATISIDKTIESGDWSSLGEKVIASVPVAALEGAKWNMIIGGGAKGLGLLADARASRLSKADEALALKVDNAAAPNTQTANVYDASRPLRSSDIIDASTEEAIAARKLTTPEVAEELRREIVPELEKRGNRLLEIEAQLDFDLQKSAKTKYVKEFQTPWTGPSFQEMMAANGITREGLEDIAKRAQGEGAGVVHAAIRKYDQALADLPADRLPTEGEMFYQLDLMKSAVQKAAARKKGYIRTALYDQGEALRATLEDPTKVSRLLAEGQAPVNFEWSHDINAQRQFEDFGFTGEGRIGGEYAGGDRLEVPEVFKPSSLENLTKQIGLPGSTAEAAEESFKARNRQRAMSFGERLRWSGANDPTHRKLLAEHMQLSHAIENDLNRIGLANRYAAANAGKQTGGLAAGAVGAIAGAAVGNIAGPLGGGVGALAGGAAAKTGSDAYKAWRVAKNADKSAAALGLKRAAVKTQERLNKSIKIQRMLDEAANTAETVAPGLVLDRVQSVIEQIDAMEDPESDEYKKTMSRIDEIRQAGGDELAEAYATQMDRRNRFLFDKAGLPPRSTVFGTESRELDEDTLATVGRSMAAADDPVGALERMGSGTATIEDGEALNALFPNLLSEWKSKVVAELAQSKKKPTTEQQEMLSAILGVGFLPGTDDASLAFLQGLSSTGADESTSANPRNRQAKPPGGYQARGDRIGA